MQIHKIREQGNLTLFEVHVDDEDPEPVKVWSTDEKHAIREAILYSTMANILVTTQLLNKLCQQGR